MTTQISTHHYTRNILLQMLIVFSLLAVVIVWQRQIVYQIYVANQLNTVGWAVNGGITLLFICGLVQLIQRSFEYRGQERAINQFKVNVKTNIEPLTGIRQDYMVAERFLTLTSLYRQRANINQSALAATLIASESSRNSFLKFVHNILILTGVFGTIISLSISLLGASDILQSTGQAATQASGLSTMIYGMSTALSTTMTAIIAYLFFGYFYIKLTDTQTFLISQIEQVTATTLMPHLQINRDAVVRDYSESIRIANELVQKLNQSQQKYADSAVALETATRNLVERVAPLELDAKASENQALMGLIREVAEQQQQATSQNYESTKEIIALLQRGFRLPRDSEQNN